MPSKSRPRRSKGPQMQETEEVVLLENREAPDGPSTVSDPATTSTCDASSDIRCRDQFNGPPVRQLDNGIRLFFCEDSACLSDIRGELKKIQKKDFLDKIMVQRCKQMFPKDILVALDEKNRPAGFLRRTLTYNKAAKKSINYIDFVYTLHPQRGRGIGRALLEEGLRCKRPKEVILKVAGGEENHKAVALYESMGFEWTSWDMYEMALTVETQLQLKPDPTPQATGAGAHEGSSGERTRITEDTEQVALDQQVLAAPETIAVNATPQAEPLPIPVPC